MQISNSIKIIGQDSQIELIKSILAPSPIEKIPYNKLESYDFSNTELVIDINLDDYPDNLLFYAPYPNLIVIGGAVKQSLAQMVASIPDTFKPTLFGLNTIPSLLDSKLWEMSVLKSSETQSLNNLLSQFAIPYKIVEDRVGMVTPRVICMIINEAYYTFQEGTATKDDIDESMRLGVNYPFGPFEWSEKIGINNVYEVLENLYQDTHDERYKVCPLLKKDYLLSKTT